MLRQAGPSARMSTYSYRPTTLFAASCWPMSVAWQPSHDVIDAARRCWHDAACLRRKKSVEILFARYFTIPFETKSNLRLLIVVTARPGEVECCDGCVAVCLSVCYVGGLWWHCNKKWNLKHDRIDQCLDYLRAKLVACMCVCVRTLKRKWLELSVQKIGTGVVLSFPRSLHHCFYTLQLLVPLVVTRTLHLQRCEVLWWIPPICLSVYLSAQDLTFFFRKLTGRCHDS